MSAAGQELARHLPCYNTQYDGKGGVAHEAHGGIWCRCGEWDSGPVKGIRPWEDYWEHVGQSVARVAVEAALAPIERVRGTWDACHCPAQRYPDEDNRVQDCPRHGDATAQYLSAGFVSHLDSALAAARDAAGRSGGEG